jgi:hypothetical protein
VFVLVLGALALSLVVGKNALLNEVRKEIGKSFAYDRLTLSYLPPALAVENLRSLVEPPVFRARRVRVEIPYLSILRNRKVLTVVLDSPEFRLSAAPAGPRRKPRRPLSVLSLPFVVERGLVENGSFVYETGSATVEARGIRGLVTQSGENFTVRAAAETSGYASANRSMKSTGALTVVLTGKGDDVTISHFSVEGPSANVVAKGRFRDFQDPEVELDASFDLDTGFLDAVLHMPFDWEGRVAGEGRLARQDGRLTFASSLSSDTLAVSGIAMGAVRGRFALAPETGGRLELGIRKPGRPAESLILTFLGGRVEGRAAPLDVAPVFAELGIPWPVSSQAWGTFSLEDRKLAADAEFRDETLERQGDRFAFRGGVKVGVDFPARRVTVETAGLESDFGRFEATAAIDLGGDIEARIRGQVSDVKETREFVSLILDEMFAFGEIRGRGTADVRLSGRSAAPAVAIKGTLSPGGFEQFDAAFVEADVSIAGGGFEGRFDVDDPELKGRVAIEGSDGTFELDVRDGDGELAAILHALGVPVALSGRAAGDFRMVQRNGSQEFSGSFTSPEVRGYGETAGNVSGRLEWKDGVLSFPELALNFHGGRLDGRFLVGTTDGAFDVDMRGEELDFGQVIPAASGRLSLALAGRGVFDRDELVGLFTVKDMVLSPLEKTEARGEIRLGVAGGRVNLGLAGKLVPGENPFEAAFAFPLSGAPFSGVVKGRVTDLDLVVPWRGAQGRIDYVAEVRKAGEATDLTVALDLLAPVMPLPGFAYAVTDLSAAMKYFDGVLTVTSIGGKLGGGNLSGSGKVGLGEGGIASMDMRFEGRDMILSPMERVRAQADASLRMLKDGNRFVTEGEILFERLTWRREIYEEFGFSTPTEDPEPAGPSFFDGMSLNIRLRADENVVIENSLGRFNGRFNLTATGSFDAPVLLGDIDLGSGDFYFQDRSFRVIHGRLSFTDPVNTEPFLDFRGETYVKDFRVTLSMSGPVSRLRPEFSSSPPLAPEEIMSLLALGDSFRRMYYSYAGDRSTALNTASLLTYQIADLAKRRTGGIFSLDRFRIDPYIPEGAPGDIAARITVGKKISENVLFLYSTILANSSVRSEIDEVPIFRVEWEVSRRFSLVGGRDDRGRLGFDVKFRKRF